MGYDVKCYIYRSIDCCKKLRFGLTPSGSIAAGTCESTVYATCFRVAHFICANHPNDRRSHCRPLTGTELAGCMT